MLKKVAINQLLILKSILNQIKESDYILPVETLKNATIGKHVRHILEFYECLLFNHADNVVSYDNRKRNQLLEENLIYTQDYILEIIDSLEKIETNKRIVLLSHYGENSVTMETTLYREITYNIEHTVHHYAIINIAILNHFNYIQLPANFGFADSTIQYLKTQKTVN